MDFFKKIKVDQITTCYPRRFTLKIKEQQIENKWMEKDT